MVLTNQKIRNAALAVAFLSATIFLCFGAAATAYAASVTQYRIEGRGWGHGIGMSQYGAQGFATKAGYSAEQIIQHYFTGTVVAPQPPTAPTSVRVVLQSHLRPARIEMTKPGVFQQGAVRVPLAAGDVIEWRVIARRLQAVRVQNGVRTVLARGGADTATINPAVDGGIKILFPAHYARSGSIFRGTFTARIFQGNVSIVNTVPLEDYLRGVVPGEMSPSWHPEALKAQAIAARSYALTGISKDEEWFDLYSDTRSQVYGGLTAEAKNTDKAIAETAGLVARVGAPTGEMARTFFFSTSAGKTAANEEVWGSVPYSYLRSVASPHEQPSPYFIWRGKEVRTYRPAQLAKALGVTGFVNVKQSLYPSGYTKDLSFGRGRTASKLSGSQVQARLGLRSSYFRVTKLTVTAPKQARNGSLVKITGTAPRSGVTQLRLVKNNRSARPIRLKVNKQGRWTIFTRAQGPITATVVRSGKSGPSVRVLAR